MRDPKRIDRIVTLLRKLWQKYPDLRLGQLLINIGGPGDLWYIEDDQWETLIENWIIKENLGKL